MECPKCGTGLPVDAKFCNECGSKLSNVCQHCGEAIKSGARFCHSCGQETSQEPAEPVVNTTRGQSWLNTAGPFLFIPIFAGIIILLFWVNRDPEPVSASSTAGTDGGGAPSMAMMEQVHSTLERLKQRVEADTTDMVALDSLAMMFSIAGSHDKAHEYYEMAKRHYDRVLASEPDNISAKVELAKTHYALRNTEEALSLLQDVLSKEPDHAFALFYLASMHEQLGHKEMAGEAWQKIVDAYPGTEMARVAEQRIHELIHPDD